MMLRLTREQRELAADKLADAGNIAAGALIFGQSLGTGALSPKLAFVGLVSWTLCVAVALSLRRQMP